VEVVSVGECGSIEHRSLVLVMCSTQWIEPGSGCEL
jgi:hypothetical protein